MKQPMKNMMRVPRFDNLNTPDIAVYPLLKYLPAKPLTIWEPADPGGSEITRILRKIGHTVITSDIRRGFDFLMDRPDFDFDMIITNPPYSEKNAWIYHCYKYDKPWALLLPTTSIGSVGRYELFKIYGVEMIIIPERIDFTGGKQNWFDISWFTWRILPHNTHVYESIKEYQDGNNSPFLPGLQKVGNRS